MSIEEAKLDQRGRINIGKKAGEKYGDRFFVVQLPNEIILIPKPKDPVKELRKWGDKAGLGNMTSEEIRNLAEEEFYKEFDQRRKRK